MGKRRDRRHAAALGGGGGRRVKLDLWNDDDIAQTTGKGVGHTTSPNVDAGDDIKAVGSVQHSSPPALPGGFTGFALVVLLQAKNMFGRAFCPKETFTNLVQPMWLGLAWLGMRVVMEPLVWLFLVAVQAQQGLLNQMLSGLFFFVSLGPAGLYVP